MNYSFTTPQDGNLSVKPFPPDVLFFDDLGQGDGYYVEGQFGILLSWHINATPYFIIRNDYTIEEQSFLHYRADGPVLQVMASLYGDTHFILEGIGDVYLQQGQFNIFYLPQPQITGVFEGLSRLQTLNIYFPVDTLRELAAYFPLQPFINKVEQSTPALLFKRAGWMTAEILAGMSYLVACPGDSLQRLYLVDKQVKELLVLLMLQKYASGKMQLPEGMFENIMEARHIIEAHVGGLLTIEEVAAAAGLTVIELRKFFKTVTGKNLADFITQARLNNSKLLLQQTDMSIKEIAAICGYEHERSFILAFQHFFKYGPSTLRKRG